MSNTNTGLNGLNLNESVITKPIGKLTLKGTAGTDLIIPENVSDSQLILKSGCDVKISEIFAGSNSVTAKGTVLFTLLLLGEDGTLGSVKTNVEFELKDFIEGVSETSILVYCGDERECNCRLINPRKLNLSSEIPISIYAMNQESVAPYIKGAETIEDEMSLKRRQGTVMFTDIYSLNEKSIPVSHDIILDGNLPPMSEIVYSNIKVRPFEAIASANNVTVKSKAIFSAIYKSVEGNIFSLEKTFVLDKTLDVDNAESYEWFANSATDDLTAEIAIDSYGESKIIELDFTYDVILNGVRNVSVATMIDAYSTEFNCETTAFESESNIYRRTYSTSLSVNSSAERTEAAAENVRSVMLGNVEVKDIATLYSDEKKRLIIEATAVISALCEDNITSETDSKYSTVVFDYPFKCELDIGDMLDGTKCQVLITVTDTRFRCDQNRIYCDFENEIRAFVSENVSCSYLTEILLDKNSPVSGPYAPITLCYPSGDETLWDIAKYYKVTTDGIASSNNLDGENISDKKVLLIPSYRKSRHVFSV